MLELISIGKCAKILGVSISTLRRWHENGFCVPYCWTFGNHRRYDLTALLKQFEFKSEREEKTCVYARVSSHDQKAQLETQALRLEKYCKDQKIENVERIADLGSGLNFNKKGLKKLIKLILEEKITRLVLITKDRLLRFG